MRSARLARERAETIRETMARLEVMEKWLRETAEGLRQWWYRDGTKDVHPLHAANRLEDLG